MIDRCVLSFTARVFLFVCVGARVLCVSEFFCSLAAVIGLSGNIAGKLGAASHKSFVATWGWRNMYLYVVRCCTLAPLYGAHAR